LGAGVDSAVASSVFAAFAGAAGSSKNFATIECELFDSTLVICSLTVSLFFSMKPSGAYSTSPA
jgi:hypothetical protein|tara:strand:- start:200 stop:391 length:192 start_codon:yes stop_codon:yes gene_type:complete